MLEFSMDLKLADVAFIPEILAGMALKNRIEVTTL